MSPENRRLHLRASVWALGASFVLIVVAIGIARGLEFHYLDALIPQSFKLKDQGLLLQRAAFARSDVLPLYGSSELVKPVGNRASVFFRRAPTDFVVSPVGRPGTTSLIVAEKLAAVGPPLRGRKVAVLLSPSFFFTRDLKPTGYAANFSALHASESLFGAELSRELRHDLAARMAQFPDTLKSQPLLRFAVSRLETDRPRDRLLYHAAMPLGWVLNSVVRVQDQLETGYFIAAHRHDLKATPHRPEELPWDRIVELWASRSAPFRLPSEDPVAKEERRYGGDAKFTSIVEQSSEWSDLLLLVRVLREFGAQPLLLSIPINGLYFDEIEISATARARYYDLLEAFGERERVPVLDFREHEMDAKFFEDTHDHLSPKGWAFFDEALDEFFHGRPFSFVSS